MAQHKGGQRRGAARRTGSNRAAVAAPVPSVDAVRGFRSAGAPEPAVEGSREPSPPGLAADALHVAVAFDTAAPRALGQKFGRHPVVGLQRTIGRDAVGTKLVCC